jgi:alginate O-acetyltransferase complex protein AlgI
MLFNSLSFLFLFLPLTYLVFWRLHSRNARYRWLTITGYVFYGAWNYKFCALMAFSTLVSYLAGRGMLAWEDPRHRRLCLIIPITIDLLLLGFFKYAGFAMTSFNQLTAALHLPVHATPIEVVLPIGISFYTFHTISYIVDSYRGVIKPTRNFFEFSCYVSLFSQLVAGPIVRFRQIEADLETIDRSDARAGLDQGWSFFTIGLAQKVLIADSIAAVIDPALGRYQELSTVGAWLCMLGYAYQLYFDFAGYSNMAIGLGRLFGVRIPFNFNSPYKALDPSDFWRRWHISLSSCLRDYLYIPLGGNRSPGWKVHRNLLLTMLIGGLWHGASWTFVLWGAYHGLLLMAYRASSKSWDQLPRPVRAAGTFVAVVVGWVLFRSTSVEMAGVLLGRMFRWHAGGVPLAFQGLCAMLLVAGAVAHLAPNTSELEHEWRPPAVLALTCLLVLSVGCLYAGYAAPFLYFQF